MCQAALGGRNCSGGRWARVAGGQGICQKSDMDDYGQTGACCLHRCFHSVNSVAVLKADGALSSGHSKTTGQMVAPPDQKRPKGELPHTPQHIFQLCCQGARVLQVCLKFVPATDWVLANVAVFGSCESVVGLSLVCLQLCDVWGCCLMSSGCLCAARDSTVLEAGSVLTMASFSAADTTTVLKYTLMERHSKKSKRGTAQEFVEHCNSSQDSCSTKYMSTAVLAAVTMLSRRHSEVCAS